MNKIAMITGASGGLAGAVAGKLTEKGWDLALVTRDLNRLTRISHRDHVKQAQDSCL